MLDGASDSEMLFFTKMKNFVRSGFSRNARIVKKQWRKNFNCSKICSKEKTTVEEKSETIFSSVFPPSVPPTRRDATRSFPEQGNFLSYEKEKQLKKFFLVEEKIIVSRFFLFEWNFYQIVSGKQWADFLFISFLFFPHALSVKKRPLEKVFM